MVLAFIFESVGAGEWLVLLAVLLIVMGPKRLPSTARQIGNYYSKFRRAAESFKRQLMEMDSEIDRAIAEVKDDVQETADDLRDEFDFSDYGPMESAPESPMLPDELIPTETAMEDASGEAINATENTNTENGDKFTQES